MWAEAGLVIILAGVPLVIGWGAYALVRFVYAKDRRLRSEPEPDGPEFPGEF